MNDKLFTTAYQPRPVPQSAIRVGDIYPNGWKVPAGWELTGEFRPVKANEAWLQPNINVACPGLKVDAPPNFIRIILRKLKTKVVTFRFQAKRHAVEGDMYTAEDSLSFYIWRSRQPSFAPFSIWTRTETEE